MDAASGVGRPADGRRVESRLVAVAWDVGPVLALVALGMLTSRQHVAEDLAAQYLVVVPLLVRRRWPLATLAIVSLIATATTMHAESPWVHVGAVALASFTTGDLRRDRATSALVVLIAAAGLSLGLLVQDADAPEAVVLSFVVFVPSWVVGDVVRWRRTDAAQRAEARERALREADERLRIAVAEERARMARELHDVVAHSRQRHGDPGRRRPAGRRRRRPSGRARRCGPSSDRSAGPGGAPPAARRPDDADDDAAALAPHPGLDRRRPSSTASGGRPARRARGRPARRRPLPPGVDVTVYRIVQEALTNALRYARGATHARRLPRRRPLGSRSLDDGPTGSGRADEDSGTASSGCASGPRVRRPVRGRSPADGGFAVRAWLPLRTRADRDDTARSGCSSPTTRRSSAAASAMILEAQPDIEVVGRGRRRRGGRPPGPPAAARRRPDGRPHAGDGRDRGDPRCSTGAPRRPRACSS